ncbi:MAG TPA: lipoyl(octanoyl) transferase LipB [Candidatus Dormibacteraeota bacterium]
MSKSQPTVRAYWLGRIGYRPAWALQRALVEQVRAGTAPSTLLLLEHEHVFSMGRRATLDHVLWDGAERDRRGVEVVWSDRGGDVTYHGPGQLVGYPILDLPALGTDILGLIRGLERSLIAYLAELGIAAEPGAPGYTGVWAGDAKVAAIGVKLNHHHVSSHGFALNLHADLDYFGGIVPCGIEDKAVTSVDRLGRRPTVHAAAKGYAAHFAREFGCQVEWKPASELAGLPAQAPPEPERLRLLPLATSG